MICVSSTSVKSDRTVQPLIEHLNLLQRGQIGILNVTDHHQCDLYPFHSIWSAGFHRTAHSRKVLAEQLKELEEDRLLERFVYK